MRVAFAATFTQELLSDNDLHSDSRSVTEWSPGLPGELTGNKPTALSRLNEISMLILISLISSDRKSVV